MADIKTSWANCRKSGENPYRRSLPANGAITITAAFRDNCPIPEKIYYNNNIFGWSMTYQRPSDESLAEERYI